MPEEAQALNADGSPSSGPTLNPPGVSSAPKAAGGLKSTVEFAVPPTDKSLKPEDPSKADGKDTEKLKDKDAEGKEKGQKKSESVPYERFQEVLDRANKSAEEIDQLKSAIEELKGGKAADKSDNDGYKPEFKDMSQMKNEELTDWIEDDPLGFIKNLASQIRYETWQDVLAFHEHTSKASQQEKAKSSTQKAMEDFAKKNPDFVDLKKSGKIKEFLKDNPWHNEISAYYELTNETRVKTAEEKAKEAARKEAEERAKAKQHARVLGAGPSASLPSGGLPPELTDTKKRGGLTSVLANRLALRRRAGSQ